MKYCLQQICNYLGSLLNLVYIICFSYIGVYLHIDEVARSDHKVTQDACRDTFSCQVWSERLEAVDLWLDHLGLMVKPKTASMNQPKQLNQPTTTHTTNGAVSPPQSSYPVTTRRRPTTPAREAPTDWTASPLDPQTLLTPRRRRLEAGWRLRWRASQSRRSRTRNSLKTSTWRSRYQGEPGWKTRWDSADGIGTARSKWTNETNIYFLFSFKL